MCSINLKDAYFQTLIHPDSHPNLQFALQGKVYQCQAPFWPYYSFPGLYQDIRFGVGVGSLEGIRLLCYLDDWLVVEELVPLLLQYWEQLLQLCQDLGIVIS